MLDFTAICLQLIKDLLVELPSRLKIIVVLGIFILGVMIALIHSRGQIIGKAATILTPHLVTGLDAALIVFLLLLVLLIIVAASYAISYRER